MKIFSTLEPQSRRNLSILFVAGLLFWASLACLLPTLPLYVADAGGTKQQIGLVIGSFAVGLLLFRPWLGKVSDCLRHHPKGDRRSRKLVLLIGYGVVAVAPLGYLFAKSIPLLLLIRIFHGISIAAYTTGSSVLVVELSPVEKRGEVIGYMSLTNPIGMAIGPAMGSFLQAQMGYTPLFVFSSVMGLLGLFCASQIQEPHLLSKSPGKVTTDGSTNALSVQPDSEQFWQLLGSPRLQIPTLVMLLVGLVIGAVVTFVALYIRETKVDLDAGWFYTATAMSSFWIRLFMGRASDRYGRGLFITVSLVFYIFSMLLLSQAQSPASFLLAGFLEGAASGTFIPAMIALISDRSHAHERGRVFALCLGGLDMGIAIAGPVLGTFAQQMGYPGVFSISLGFTFLALIIFMTQNGKDLRHSLRFATGREPDIYAL